MNRLLRWQTKASAPILRGMSMTDQSRDREGPSNCRLQNVPIRDRWSGVKRHADWKIQPIFKVAALTIMVGAGCEKPMDSLQVVLDRHAKAVSRLPEEQQEKLLPYGSPLTGEKVTALLPPDVLGLEQAHAIAVRGNPGVHAAQARLESAAARIDEARSQYFPSVSFSQSDTRIFQVPESRTKLASAVQPSPILPTELNQTSIALTTLLNALRSFGGGASGTSSSFSEHFTGFSATWSIFDGFVREANILAAKHLHAATRYSLLDVQRLIIRSVDAAYYQIQLAEEQLRISKAAEDFSREQLEETRKLQNAGRATVADVDNFRVRVLAARAEVESAAGMLETGRVVLAEIMGIPIVELPPGLQLTPLADETETEMTEPQAGPFLEKALRERMDVLQLVEIFQSEEERVRAAKGAYNPKLIGSASWGFDRTANMHYSEDDQSSAAGIEMRWEIFSGGRRDAQVRVVEGDRAEAAANLNRMRLAVQSEVRKAIIDVTRAQAQIRLQRENLQTAHENRRIIQAGYLAGRENLNRLNEAQRDFIRADADLALARIRLREAWSDLHASAADNLHPSDPPAVIDHSAGKNEPSN